MAIFMNAKAVCNLPYYAERLGLTIRDKVTISASSPLSWGATLYEAFEGVKWERVHQTISANDITIFAFK